MRRLPELSAWLARGLRRKAYSLKVLELPDEPDRIGHPGLVSFTFVSDPVPNARSSSDFFELLNILPFTPFVGLGRLVNQHSETQESGSGPCQFDRAVRHTMMTVFDGDGVDDLEK